MNSHIEDFADHYGIEYLEAIGEDDVAPIPMEDIESHFSSSREMFDLIEETGYDAMGQGTPFDMAADFFIIDVEGNIASLKRDDLAEYLLSSTAIAEDPDEFMDWCRDEGYLND